MAPKWQEFHQSLARMLGVTMGLLDKEGEILALFNPRPPFSILKQYPRLDAAYQDVFRSCQSRTAVCIERGPLSDLLAVIPLDRGMLFISGGMEREDFQAEGRLASILKALEIPLPSKEVVPERCNLNEIKAAALSVQTLYMRLLYSINEASDFGQEAVLLAALDEINKLMVGLLSSQTFDLRLIIDLIASSLVILLDARGAWVFSKCHSRSETIVRGDYYILEEAAKAWSDSVLSGTDSLRTTDMLLKGVDSVFHFSVHFADSSLSLGVYLPEGENIQFALSAFSKPAVIAMEMDSLYNVLQRRIGELLNSLRHGVIVTNPEGQVMVLNRAAVNTLGKLRTNYALGCSIADLGLSPEMEKAVSQAAEGYAYFEKQSLLHHKDGSIYVNWDTAPLIETGGKIVGAIMLFEEITEAVTLARQLKEWERLAAAGEVAAGLAHEIRNPLAAARGALQLFEMVDTDVQRRELLDRFSRELDRMNYILTDYLNLTKSPGEDCLGPLNLAEVLDDIKFLIKSEANLYSVELVINVLSNGTPWVQGNSSSVKQVFLNIAKNALEAMVDGGSLTLALGKDDASVWVEFKDNGPGIPPEHQVNIFKPFFTTKVGGTGLGLAISQRIIKSMGGEINFLSAPGAGTIVTVVLPIWQGN